MIVPLRAVPGVSAGVSRAQALTALLASVLNAPA